MIKLKQLDRPSTAVCFRYHYVQDRDDDCVCNMTEVIVPMQTVFGYPKKGWIGNNNKSRGETMQVYSRALRARY